MLIAEVQIGKPQINLLFEEKQIIRLGKGTAKTKRLNEGAIARCISTLQEYKSIIKSYRVDKVSTVATEVIRSAENRQALLERARREVGLEIKLLSAEEEAKLVYSGVTYDLPAENFLIIDVGGGSTELILGDSAGYKCSTSIKIGAVYVTEKFLAQGPVSNSEYNNMLDYIRSLVRPAIGEIGLVTPIYVIGAGGTFTTLGIINLNLRKYDRRRIHGCLLKLSDVNDILNKLRRLPRVERVQLVEHEPATADIIVAGAAIVKVMIDELKVDKVIISENHILHGMVNNMKDLTSRKQGK